MILALPLIAAAQGSAVPARVTDRVNLSQLTTLKGNTHALAQTRYDQGPVPSDLPMNRMLLVLQRSAGQESALQNLLIQQQVTGSTSFRKWLTPDQFGQQFGIADSDIQAVTSWLASFGFQSIQVAKGRNIVEFSGTAGQIEAGFHTSIHQYLVNGELHYANSSDPQIPTALAPVIAGIVSMHNFRPKPTIHQSDKKLSATVTPGAKPQIDLCTVSTSPCPAADLLHALVPGDFNTIYNIAPAMTGAGVTIGIIADTNINVNDVANFRSLWGLPTNTPTVVLNGPDPGDVPGSGPEGEAVLDATWSGAVAPLAAVDLVVSEDTNAAQGTDLSELYIVDNNLADVMTESFEACEEEFAAAGDLSGAAQFYSGLAEQAAAQGITFSVASGDGGPDSCDDPSTLPTTPLASVNLLAATPFNVAVGGTMFNDLANPSTYWSATNNGTTGASALSYIPENAWNESCTTLSASCVVTGLWSSGGGQSVAFPKPVWQAGVTGIPSTNARFLPDVAMNAANHDGYVLCIDGSCANSSSIEFGIASGTSASAQVFGGVMALVDQKTGTRVGIANYALYKLAANETYANCNASTVTNLASISTCIFNDITLVSTNIPGETGFAAGTGYDETTGLGSVNVSNLVNNWNTVIIDATTTTFLLNNGGALNTLTHGQSVPVSVHVAPVAPATGTPTGDVSLLANSNTGQGVDGFTLANGVVNSLNNSTIFLPGGTYQVHAHYEGDGTFLGSDSAPVTVTVNREGSEINFGLVISTATTCSVFSSVPYGSPYVLTVDVSDLNVVSTPCAPNETGAAPTGTVTLTDSLNGGTALPLDGGTFKLNSFGYFEDQAIQLAVGTHTISAAYSGDNSFSPPSNPASGAITIVKATTTSKVSGPSSIAANTAFALTVLVDTLTSTNPPVGSTGVAPTGTVTFSATTTAALIAPERRRWVGPNVYILAEASVLLVCMYLLLVAAEKRRGRIILGMTIVFVIATATSCGGGSSSNNNGGGSGGTTTVTLGTANVTSTPDANGFAAATATLNTAMVGGSGTITATYSGDANYNGSTSPAISITVP
jgi:hypothetical protein